MDGLAGVKWRGQVTARPTSKYARQTRE
jgi:hypothetical protein